MNKNFHFIGIGGIGMSGLARILLKQNMTVSGSDTSTNKIIEKLVKQGATIHLGHNPKHVCAGHTVVYSTSVTESNPEYQSARQKKCHLMHRSDLLKYLMEGYKSIAITGTHGKTTTSSLLAHVLLHSGYSPTYAIGGMLISEQCNSDLGEGDYFIAEADESDGTFLKYSPYATIITNIGCGDHIENYGSQDALTEAYRNFSLKFNDDELIFYCADDDRLNSLNINGTSYGFKEGVSLRAVNCRQKKWSSFFDIIHKDVCYKDVELSLIGKHNISNAVAVWGLAMNLGVLEGDIRAAFINFKGVSRRCEKKAEINGVKIFDDYAHHPTEIATTLKAIRAAVGNRRLMVLFQPHRYTRTRDCLKLYRKAFECADKVVVTDIYSAGENAIAGVTPCKVIEESGHNNAVYIEREILAKKVSSFLNDYDVVVTMGAGDITTVSTELLEWSNE